MKTYRVILELQGGLGTPLAADTLWGHLCWGIRYAQGEPALREWLARYDRDDPPLILSDPLPEGFWPRPALPPALSEKSDRPPQIEHADHHKQLVKRHWISHEAWKALCRELSPERVQRAVEAPFPQPLAAVEGVDLHAGINRLTGGTAQEGGGLLFTTRKAYFPEPVRFDVWCLSPESGETVRNWFELGTAGGYGRDASTGCGQLEVKSVAPAALDAPPDANAVLLLGPAVPHPRDPHRGFFQWGIRCGRVGGMYSIGELPGGVTNRQKRPVYCLLAGTVLVGRESPAASVGRVLSGVHDVPDIRHCGLAPTLPCRLSEELLSDPLLKEPAA